MKRARIAIFVNVLVPGSGLIVLRREWLGLAVAVLFTVLAQIAVFGRWIVPQDVPAWVSGGASLAAGAVWGLAQWLGWAQARFNESAELRRELEMLRARAEEALARGDNAAARRELLAAGSLDDEDVACLALWARLMTETGETAAARRAWRRVVALDAKGADVQAARAALEPH